MKAFLFTCSTAPETQVLSDRPEGDNLPADLCRGGTWHPVGNVDLTVPGGAPGAHMDIDTEAARKDLSERGWHMVTGGPTDAINAQSDI